MVMTECLHFNGYKPCGHNTVCNSACAHLSKVNQRILIVHLGALGAVVRATSILKAIQKKYPSSHITWVTDAPAQGLLKNHSKIQRVLTTNSSDLLTLSAIEFDVAFVIDKSLKAAGVLAQTRAREVFGFKANPLSGAILPATAAAEELWQLGLNDQKKFFENVKPETQLMIEALELGKFQRDPYDIDLSLEEKLEVSKRQYQWSLFGEKVILGFNTGCSDVIAAKKWTVDFHREIIQNYCSDPRFQVVLLGGPEDSERNCKIAEGLNVINSSTTAGLRDGLISVAACDLVVTGDSLGMHMAIAMRKFVVAWFGPTCAHEIDLYDRGISLLADAPCAPCWKRTCQKDKMCYDLVAPEKVIAAIEKGYEFCLSDQQPMSTFKQPSLEIFS